MTCDLPTETAEEAEPAEPELICDKKKVILHEHTSDCFDNGDLICGKIQVLEHQHTDACFETVEEPVDTETLTCTLPEDENHTHGPLCYGTWKLTCGLEEHQHSEACQAAELTEEEQGQVEEVIALIDTLPASEEIEETAEAFEEAEDEDGLETYLSELYPQVNAAYEAYSALTDAQKAKVTNADKLMELEWIWSAATLDLESGVLTDDSAYVESIAISQYDTGTAPFDSDDRPGNDSSSTNMVVRTFDTVTYNIKVKYLTYENGKTFNDARVKLEFVLPVDVSQAEFDQTAMGWMEDPVLTTETRTINGVETQCQVLTSYKHLLPSADHTSVVPGEFGENVSVNIKMMKNGDTIAPIFSAAMEYNTWDGTCATHNAEEKKTIVADDITISAAPKYNVQIKPAAAAEASMTYDFSRSSSQLFNVDKALNLDAGQRPGRIYVMGVTLQLYNDNESKQMRGIELPQGPITFEIKLSSKFQPVYRTAQATTAAGTVTDVTDEYTPLVWSYGPQSDGNNPDRNTWMTSYGYAFGSAAPWNQSGDRDNGCYNGGTWTAVQNGSTVTFTVTDYQFDGVFPCTDAGNTASSSTYYNKATGVRNIGCFSAMELYIVQPYTNTSGTQVLDDFSAIGSHSQNVGTGYCIDGSFLMTVEDVNLTATSVSGQALASASDSNANQGAKYDDKREFSVNLKRPGNYEQRHLYSDKNSFGMRDIFGVWENQAGTCAGNGNDWAVIGTDFRLVFGGYALTNGDDANKMCAAKWLLKFDPEAIELTEGRGGNGETNYYNNQFLYAVKSDGKRWVNDTELKNTSMFQLCYYSSIEEAKTHGEIVGILVEAAPKSAIEAIPSGVLTTYFYQNAKVKEDPSLANQRFIITEESMIWTVDNFTAAGQNIPSLLGNNPSSPTTLPQYTFYVNSPSVYLNGDGVYDKHVGGYTQGDTLLVLSYKASILKKVEQKMPDGKTDKDTYNLDADQRVIDFVLDPSVDYGGPKPEQRQTTTVTIVDRLPQYLYYRSGSSYFGGTYTQTSTNGGTQGTITGGVLNEPTVVTNADGTQTLTWVIPDVVVGEKMPLIHYSVNVGTKGDETKDVPLGTTNLTNTVEISATGDERIHSISFGNVAEEGVVLTRGTASSYGKYSTNTVVEPDGEIHYVIYYDNNATVSIPNIVMLDTMPRNGYFGNSFTGSYTVKSWKLNAGKCEPSSFTLYYTLDAKYAGKTLQEISEEEIKTWTSAAINADGTVTDMNGKMPVAWALIGTLNAQEGVYVDLTIKLEPGESGGTNNVYHNMFSHGNTVTTTEEHSVIRTLEGLTWLDDSTDGIQNEDIGNRLSGIKVSLWKLKNGGDPANENDYEPYCYPGTTTQIVIETGKQISVLASNANAATVYEEGRYKFTDLPAGTFAVKFEDGSTKISPLIVSPANRGGNDDTIDSDGIAAYNSDKSQLLKTVILGIDLPTAEQMNVVLYESKYHDSGFYERGTELPSTGGAGTVPYTMGGSLLLTGAAFLLLYNHTKRRKEDSSSS
ncbi:MAG: LPXTG cell wall anchor domain-containing protein [bacterium]|nr:LPXTG cell wall anchor domain-containing protein [bacterium]